MALNAIKAINLIKKELEVWQKFTKTFWSFKFFDLKTS